MRTFIAIDLNEDIKKKLSDLLNQLDTGNRNIRWVKRQAMHVTLKFLGEISETRVKEVVSVAKKIVSKHPPFPLKIKGTGTFPPGKKPPRVLWTGIEASQTLFDLQTQIENELGKIGFTKEKRKFHPHLTLGRVKTRFDLSSILTLLDRHKETEFGRMTVKKIALFRSILKPTGAEYSILSEFSLK